MPLVVVTWPNRTISVVRMPRGYSRADLFDELDQEGSPFHCLQIWECRPDARGLHIGTTAAANGVLRLELLAGRKRRITFAGFSWRDALKRYFGGTVDDAGE